MSEDCCVGGGVHSSATFQGRCLSCNLYQQRNCSCRKLISSSIASQGPALQAAGVGDPSCNCHWIGELINAIASTLDTGSSCDKVLVIPDAHRK